VSLSWLNLTRPSLVPLPSLSMLLLRLSLARGERTIRSSQNKVGGLIAGIMERRLDGGYQIFAPEVCSP